MSSCPDLTRAAGPSHERCRAIPLPARPAALLLPARRTRL